MVLLGGAWAGATAETTGRKSCEGFFLGLWPLCPEWVRCRTTLPVSTVLQMALAETRGFPGGGSGGRPRGHPALVNNS